MCATATIRLRARVFRANVRTLHHFLFPRSGSGSLLASKPGLFLASAEGSIEGKAEAAEKVYIRKAAKVVGDIYSAGIVIEDGGYVKGNIDLSRHPMDSQTHPAVAGSYSDHSEAHPIHELSDMALARQETKSMKAV